MGMEWSVPTTNSPACPATVQWFGKPGMVGYGMVILGELASSAWERPERPEPQMIPTRGGDMEWVWSWDRMEDAAVR